MKIACCISGGIDSFYALNWAIENFENVYAVFLNFLNNSDQINDVKNVAKKLKVPLKIFDCSHLFKIKIIDYFVNEYLKGRTPNPCIFCNAIFKFEYVLSKGFEKVITGHYARIKRSNEKFFIFKGKDEKKDQSYFLSRIKKEILPNIILPLGDKTKEEVKQELRDFYSKKESQEICFIQNNDYKIFLQKYKKLVSKKGKILNSKGKLLGFHNGYFNFTIGQRKGLNIAMGEPYYVIKIDPKKNIVYAGPLKETENKRFFISSQNWYDDPKKYDEIFVKVRYRSSAKKCIIKNNLKEVELIDIERSITPGQIAVFYVKNFVIGSGIIESAE